MFLSPSDDWCISWDEQERKERTKRGNGRGGEERKREGKRGKERRKEEMGEERRCKEMRGKKRDGMKGVGREKVERRLRK